MATVFSRVPVAGLWLVLLGVVGQAFLAVPCVQAADLVGLEKEYATYRDRLREQVLTVRADYEYVQGASSLLPGKESLIRSKAAKLRSAAAQCRQSLANRTLDVCTVRSRGQELSVGKAESLAREYEELAGQCSVFAKEAALDRRTLADRLREIETLAADLEEWKAMNDEAVAEQIRTVAVYLFGQFAEYLADQAKAARTLSRLVNQHQAELAAKGMNVPFAQAKLLSLHNQFLMARITASTGGALKQTDPVGLYDLLKNTVVLVADLESRSMSSVRELMDDPAMKDVLKKDGVALETANILAQKVPEKLLEMKNVQKVLSVAKNSKIMPVVGIASLVIDTSYNATQWGVSLGQIKDRYELTEKSNNAVASLHRLVGQRKTRWSRCLNF